PDERQVAQPLDAQVPGPPLRMELAAERVQPLELEDIVGCEQHAPERAARDRARALALDEVREGAEVEGDLFRLTLARPFERLDDEELRQPVRRLAAAAHRAERPPTPRGRGSEMKEAVDLAVRPFRDREARTGGVEIVERHGE